jgi:NAD-dependent dihydropyrimidine dehydrogenase PreA subunit
MISVDQDRCTGCGVCVGVCPTGAISVVNGVARIRHGLCKRCKVCIPACPTDALSVGEESAETQEVESRRVGKAWSTTAARGRGLERGTEMGWRTRRGLHRGRRTAVGPTTRAPSVSPGGSSEGEVVELKDMLGDMREELAEVLDRLDRLGRESR